MTPYEKIYEQVRSMPIIDTHEHLFCWESQQDMDTDVIREYMTHYFSTDLVAAGMDVRVMEEQIKGKGLSLLEKWDMIQPYWQAARFTGYGRALRLAAKILYGVDRIERNTIEELNEKFLSARRAGNHYHRVLKDVCNIEVSILDNQPDCDKTYFRPTVHVDGWIVPHTLQEMDALCQKFGFAMTSLEDYAEAVDREIEEQFANGGACYKCALAYQRSLYYPLATQHEAEADFRDMLARRHIRPGDGAAIQSGAAFQNFMMHHILRVANRKGRAFQFHTGLHESYGSILRDSDPSHLTNLFLNYPEVRFDLFHMSYPFMGIAGALAKNHHNVFLDMCWANIISPMEASDWLARWLDAVPANKISAFGGDYCFLDGVAGHAAIARENISRALAVKVEQQVMDVEEAVALARHLFYYNPKRIFALDA